MKTALFLMTNKGYEVLKTLIEAGFTAAIDKVIIGLDPAVVHDYSAEIMQLCEKHKVVYFFSNQEYTISASYVLAVSWRWMVKVQDFKLIVLHDSLLPKYRGFAPLVNALINGDDVLGVTALFASEEYDRGAIILQKTTPIQYPITINEAILKVSTLYSEIVLEIFIKIREGGTITSFPQIEDKATYSLWRDSEDYFINWNCSSSTIKRFIDAVGFPYQGAKCFIEDEIIIIIKATVVEDVFIENRTVGKVIFIKNDLPIIVCSEGLLQINEAVFEHSKCSILPLKKFRTRFK
jgi:methionyl-tRNA formyltransferase